MQKEKVTKAVGRGINSNSDTKVNNHEINRRMEDAILSACFKISWNDYPQTRRCLFHVPNERKQSEIQGNLMKAKGVVPGVADFIFLWRGKSHCLECKTETGKQSASQIEWEKAIKPHSNYYIFRNEYQFRKILESILCNF